MTKTTIGDVLMPLAQGALQAVELGRELLADTLNAQGTGDGGDTGEWDVTDDEYLRRKVFETLRLIDESAGCEIASADSTHALLGRAFRQVLIEYGVQVPLEAEE